LVLFYFSIKFLCTNQLYGIGFYFILFYFLHHNTNRFTKKTICSALSCFCNINSLHQLRVAERGENLFMWTSLLVFSAHEEDQTKSLTCRVKIITICFCFRTLMRIANKCGGGRWKNLLVAEETSVVQHRRPHVCVCTQFIHEQQVWKRRIKTFCFVGCNRLMVISYGGMYD
jgi:hypothetical protein